MELAGLEPATSRVRCGGGLRRQSQPVDKSRSEDTFEASSAAVSAGGDVAALYDAA
jgi:hypothetical protein